jgi:hypothetical protein
MDSVLGAPAIPSKVQGPVGSQLLLNGTNAVWSQGTTAMDTLTVNANHIDLDALVNTAGTAETAVSNSITIVPNMVYRLLATETHTSGAHIIVNGTGGVPTTTLAAGANNIYFRASAAATVLTVGYGAAQGNNSCTFTLYAYSQPAWGRLFSHSAQLTLKFDWMAPLDWDGSAVYWQWTGAVDNATPPGNGETIICQLSGVAFSSSDSLAQAMGTPVSSTFTGASHVRYDEMISALSGALTIANSPAAGKKVKFALDCLTTGTYAQPGPFMTGWNLKFGRTLAH